MATESWGEISVPDESKPFVGIDPAADPGGAETVVTGRIEAGTVYIDGVSAPDSGDRKWVADPKTLIGTSLRVTAVRTPPKVTVNGVQLGAVSDGVNERTDELGEKVYEFKLDESQLRRLMEQNGVPYVDKNEVEKIVDSMSQIFAIAEQMKKTLSDRGWTYEEAERVSADFMRDMIAHNVKKAEGLV